MGSCGEMLETLNSYRELAQDPTKHSIVMKDKTMVQFLAYSLDSHESEVTETALKTIESLIENEENRPMLRSTFGVLEALQATSERIDIDSTITTLAKELHDMLSTNGPAFSTRSRTNKMALNVTDQTMSKKLTSKVYHFHVFGLNESTRSELESTVIRVKGVISVIVDVEHQRCVVRSIEKVTSETLAEKILSIGLEAKLIIRNKNNQEVLQDVLKKNEDEEKNEEEVDGLPAYLPEEESPVKENAVLSFDKFRNNAVSFLKTATSLFQSSFYW